MSETRVIKAIKGHGRIFLPVMLICAACIRLINIGKDFSGDEGLTLHISSLRLGNLFSALLERDIYPPLTYLLVHFWRTISDTNAWARLYFVFFGIGVCFLAYKTAKVLFNERLAKTVLVITVFSPLLVYLSQYARSYIDSAFWIMFSCYIFLKIINGNTRIGTWLAYLCTTTLAIYTFYFSAFFIVTQAIYLVIFYRKDKRLIAGWAAGIVSVCILFLPWLPHALAQFSNGSSLIYDWSTKGFGIYGLRLGLYTRNIVSLFGMDPSFMVFKGSILQFIRVEFLALAAVLAFLGLFFFLAYCRYLSIRDFPQQRRSYWFVVFFAFIPLGLSWLSATFLNLIPNAKYIVVAHVFFIFCIGIFFCAQLKNKPLRGAIAVLCLLILFIARFPKVWLPDFEVTRVRAFRSQNIGSDECILCVFSPYPLAKDKNTMVINEGEHFVLNETKSEYISANLKQWEQLKAKVNLFQGIWYIRLFSIQEVFGLNKIVMEWLEDNGFERFETKSFNNMELILYKKENENTANKSTAR